MKIVVVVQARMGSSRLPGKVLKPILGRSVLERQLERMQAARTPFELVVAATEDPSDDGIITVCEAAGIATYRGHPTDLLDRHWAAARAHGADIVVKIPSDCPLIDPAVIDRVLAFFLENPTAWDFVSNLHPATYPDGNDVEVMTMAALSRAKQEATAAHEREHTTPYFWDEPGRFRVANLTWPTGQDYSMSHRFTIDYAEDYTFIQAVYEALYRPEAPIFGLRTILDLLEARPEIYEINAMHAGVNWYRHHLGELKTVSAEHTRNEGSAAENRGLS